jgi:hypothetical protein
MLQHLSTADAVVVAEAVGRVSRDEKAMVDYLGIGRRGQSPGRGPARGPAITFVRASDPAAFDSAERHALEVLLRGLSPEARLELLALLWFGRGMVDFKGALRRARRVPEPHQVATLMGARLERHIPAALAKLGLRP